jgi:signal transduction histidine kinase
MADLQLTLAHALKRSAGAVRAHFKAIRRHTGDHPPEPVAHAFTRIEEELSFQSALAEQTRLWHEVPESTFEGISLRGCLDVILEELRSAYPAASCIVEVDSALRVRASREVLREILHGLLENAFHATAFVEGLAAPRVEVRASIEGATVRVDILDNGPGVAPGDRERIFDLYVTTKKGGDSKPLGTGMGLPIARRYAQHIGGQVGLDPDHEQTCFFVRLVAWRDLG